MAVIELNPEHIRNQIDRLSRRVYERFPEKGLFEVSKQMRMRAKERLKEKLNVR